MRLPKRFYLGTVTGAVVTIFKSPSNRPISLVPNLCRSGKSVLLFGEIAYLVLLIFVYNTQVRFCYCTIGRNKVFMHKNIKKKSKFLCLKRFFNSGHDGQNCGYFICLVVQFLFSPSLLF